jgi:hypothetical protein
MSGGAANRKKPFTSHPQYATKKSDKSTQAFVRKSRETKSKMVAIAGILDERRSCINSRLYTDQYYSPIVFYFHCLMARSHPSPYLLLSLDIARHYRTTKVHHARFDLR